MNLVNALSAKLPHLAQSHTVMQEANLRRQQGNLVAAQALYEQTLKLQPNSAHTLNWRGVIADQTGNPKKTVILVWSPALQVAVGLHRQSQLTRAQPIYEDILQAQPRHFDALHLLGVIAAVTGNPNRAVDLFRRALEIAPDNAFAHNNLGSALQELGQ